MVMNAYLNGSFQLAFLIHRFIFLNSQSNLDNYKYGFMKIINSF